MPLPRGLQTITFGEDLDHSLENVALRSALQTITSSDLCNQIDTTPTSLRVFIALLLETSKILDSRKRWWVGSGMVGLRACFAGRLRDLGAIVHKGCSSEDLHLLCLDHDTLNALISFGVRFNQCFENVSLPSIRGIYW